MYYYYQGDIFYSLLFPFISQTWLSLSYQLCDLEYINETFITLSHQKTLLNTFSTSGTIVGVEVYVFDLQVFVVQLGKQADTEMITIQQVKASESTEEGTRLVWQGQGRLPGRAEMAYTVPSDQKDQHCEAEESGTVSLWV